jgi:hypothetical protein
LVQSYRWGPGAEFSVVDDFLIEVAIPCMLDVRNHCYMCDPEERTVRHQDEQRIREKMLDKTLAPSSIPDPSSDSLS